MKLFLAVFFTFFALLFWNELVLIPAFSPYIGHMNLGYGDAIVISGFIQSIGALFNNLVDREVIVTVSSQKK